jgi:ATP-dependent DNA ligase
LNYQAAVVLPVHVYALRSRPGPTARTGFIEPCLPRPARQRPSGSGWLHEIKFDGYRLMVRRHGAGVRLITRRAAMTGPTAFPRFAIRRSVSSAAQVVDRPSK